MNNLKKYGLHQRFITESTMYPNLFLARVISQYKDMYKIATDECEILAEVSGKFSYNTAHNSDYPAVGDFVMVDRLNDASGNGIIHHVLSRNSVFERKSVSNENESQIIATNIDIIFICMSLNNDFNLRRLERYLSICWDSGATPKVILTKSDLCPNISELLSEVDNIAIGADIFVTSDKEPESINAIKSLLKENTTASFVGSSGVGKSTLINNLLEDMIIKTSDIRESDHKGKHTTTRREMFPLCGGGVLIDTPGMREIGIVSANFGLSFSDIDELTLKCKFKDCKHENEPGCAVLIAINSGALDRERFESYIKLKKEATYDGMNSREIENKKIENMFGSKGSMKSFRKQWKENNKSK